MIAVSACLAGIACRYDGKDKEITKIKQMVENGEAIPFLPRSSWWTAHTKKPCRNNRRRWQRCLARSCKSG